MVDVRSRLSAYGWRRIATTLLVLVPLALYIGLLQGWRNQAFLVTSWLGGVGLLPPEFYDIAHRLHEFAFALVFWPMLVGLLTQLRSPKRHVAGLLMAFVALGSWVLAFALTNWWKPAMIVVFLGVPTVLAALTHPAGRGILGWFSVDRVNRVTLVLVVVAAVPLLAFTATQVGLQTGAIEPTHDGHGHEHGGAGDAEKTHEEHLKFGHFTMASAFVFAVIGLGLLASLQPPGWWLAAWVTGLMMATYAIAGLLAPDAASNPGMTWNLAAIAWSLVFIAAAEMTQDGESPSLLGARGIRAAR